LAESIGDTGNPDKRERAQIDVWRRVATSSSTQVLTEFAVATRKLTVAVPRQAEAGPPLSILPVVAIDASLVMSAISGSRVWQISIWDALIIRAAEVAGCRRVLSEDLADGRIYGSVAVENPFA
jgi:predicted nucleic acid-binding protein